VPLRAGGVSFHHQRTLHHARPNTTDRTRRSWATEFQTAPVTLEVPADRPWVGDGQRAMADAFAAKRP
jgi:ectoine hydroxylase-related dioxygenase (phytanoyl-CoA dioxygenase family)